MPCRPQSLGGVAPSALIRLDQLLIHALTGVAIACRPFGPVMLEDRCKAFLDGLLLLQPNYAYSELPEVCRVKLRCCKSIDKLKFVGQFGAIQMKKGRACLNARPLQRDQAGIRNQPLRVETLVTLISCRRFSQPLLARATAPVLSCPVARRARPIADRGRPFSHRVDLRECRECRR
jgi:hypothetical protein